MLEKRPSTRPKKSFKIKIVKTMKIAEENPRKEANVEENDSNEAKEVENQQ